MRAEPWVRAQTVLLSREGLREGAKTRSVAWSRSQREVGLEEKKKKGWQIRWCSALGLGRHHAHQWMLTAVGPGSKSSGTDLEVWAQSPSVLNPWAQSPSVLNPCAQSPSVLNPCTLADAMGQP